MKFISDHADYEMMSVISAVHKDSKSWLGWNYVRISMECALPLPAWSDICDLLQSHAGDKEGAAFLCRSNEIMVFCKGVHPHILHRLGDLIIALLSAHGIIAELSIRDVAQDWEKLSATYSYEALIRKQAAPLQPTNQIPERDRREGSPLAYRRRVLLVEDDPVTRWLVRGALKGECVLHTAQNVQTAIASYQACKPDIVFLDLNLPDGNGSEVMRDILKHDPGAYIVIFSSHDSMDNIVSLLENGARGFIAKPFSRDLLMGHLKSLFAA